MDAPIIELRFTGEGMHPNTVSAHDLAKILIAIETVVLETAHTDEALQEIPSSTLYLSLDTIKEGSLSLGLGLSEPKPLMRVWYYIGEVIQDNRFLDFPQKAYQAIRNLFTFVEKRNCVAEFRIHDNPVPLAVITPQTEILEVPIIREETVIYGMVTRVGGSTPIVRIVPENERGVSCTADIVTAKKLALKLYEYVGLAGIAHRNFETLDLIDFEIERILEYDESSSLITMFDNLRTLAGSYFDSIDNVDEYIRSIRHDLWEVIDEE